MTGRLPDQPMRADAAGASSLAAPPPAIDVCGVTKSYRLHVKPVDRLLAAMGRGALPVAEHHALKGISFRVARGESVGLLGVNGAGKSTLLQIIAGTLRPTAGSVVVNGRIAALLELGAGFNRDWSGRRNAEFHCIVAGTPAADIARRLAGIEAFADVGAFFDQPMRSYSSGMYMRVAFAAAVAVDPDILIVDEALAVGDARFQNKCYARFRTLQEAGCTILFVTHSTELVKQFCSRGILLDQGRVDVDGPAVDVTERYLELLHGRYEDNAVSARPASASVPARAPVEIMPGNMSERPHHNASSGRRFGDGAMEIVDFEVLDSDGLPAPLSIPTGASLTVRIIARAKMEIDHPYIGWILKRVDDTVVMGTDTRSQKLQGPMLANDELWCVELSFVAAVGGGDYFFDLGAGRFIDNGYVAGDWRPSIGHFQVTQKRDFYGIANLNAKLSDRTIQVSAASPRGEPVALTAGNARP